MRTFVHDAALIVLLAVIGVLLWIMWHEFGLIDQMIFGS